MPLPPRVCKRPDSAKRRTHVSNISKTTGDDSRQCVSHHEFVIDELHDSPGPARQHPCSFLCIMGGDTWSGKCLKSAMRPHSAWRSGDTRLGTNVALAFQHPNLVADISKELAQRHARPGEKLSRKLQAEQRRRDWQPSHCGPHPLPPCPPEACVLRPPQCPTLARSEHGQEQVAKSGQCPAWAAMGQDTVPSASHGASEGDGVLFEIEAGQILSGATYMADCDDDVVLSLPRRPPTMPARSWSATRLRRKYAEEAPDVDVERVTPLVRPPHAAALCHRLIPKASVHRAYSIIDRQNSTCSLDEHLESVFRQMPLRVPDPTLLAA